MKVLLSLLIALLCFSAYGQADGDTLSQPEEQNTVIIRVVETWYKKDKLSFWGQFSKKLPIKAEIHISHSNGRFRREVLNPDGIRNVRDNMQLIHKTLKPYLTDQYQLVSHYAVEDKKKAQYMWIFKEKTE